MKIDLITEITLLIERYPGKVSRHGLLFDDLTVEEMYKDGFCGPIEFQTKKGTETIMASTPPKKLWCVAPSFTVPSYNG